MPNLLLLFQVMLLEFLKSMAIRLTLRSWSLLVLMISINNDLVINDGTKVQYILNPQKDFIIYFTLF